ncbi:MAG: FtsL-like putative cell division protein, partial [Bacteroidetes bacterium]|nr:FtsL-like putative cell division protein [Bacteroidota bacterium]
FTFFTFVIIVLYISIQQYAERTVRNTEKLTREIKELRSEYLSTKAELMKQSMQTDIAKKLEAGGLKELRTPAMKLKLEADKSK